MILTLRDSAWKYQQIKLDENEYLRVRDTYACSHTQISDIYNTQGCVYLLFTHKYTYYIRWCTYNTHIYPQINMHSCAHMYAHHT